MTDPQEISAPEPIASVGVYYCPWYGDDFHGGSYLRAHLQPPQLPELGEYDDRCADVIAQHLRWSRDVNISLWVASWWGPGRREDTTLLQHILPHPDLPDMRIALFYETAGRVPSFTDVSNVAADIAYIADHYFDDPTYLRIDDRPVLFVYLTRALSRHGTLEKVVTLMRDTTRKAGHEIYLVGDEVFGAPPDDSGSMGFLDAVTNYDVYGSMGGTGFAGQQAVDDYYAAQTKWRDQAKTAGAAFIPTVTPEFNDKGVRDGHAAVTRRLTERDEYGSLFRAMLQQAVTLTDAAVGRLLLVTSWNEWHEDTQIEPVVLSDPTRVDDSGDQYYTEGVDYEGYGNRYLRILKKETTQ
ncbi:MAG: glycoside hydrolase family 99-like domain-containing protein [Candidatus Latescibacterota bacterium]|nr:glycoside hydrolase family 99-like domain-containing protein [Candidatus Latescibacterota bacterium]